MASICGICSIRFRDTHRKVFIARCKHSFHVTCIRNAKDRECPQCQTPFDLHIIKRKLMPNVFLNQPHISLETTAYVYSEVAVRCYTFLTEVLLMLLYVTVAFCIVACISDRTLRCILSAAMRL